MDGNSTNDVLIINTGRGSLGTITERAWYVTHMRNHKTSVSGYKDRSTPRVHIIVHVVMKGLNENNLRILFANISLSVTSHFEINLFLLFISYFGILELYIIIAD